jgi:cyanate permease
MVAFSAMGALPFGLIYDRTGSYDDAIFILLILPVIAGIAYMLAKEPKLKSKLNVF